MLKKVFFLLALMAISTSGAMATTLYDFESGTQGWITSTWPGDDYMTAVNQSSAQQHGGSYSLAGTITNLIANKSGQALVQPSTPLDLSEQVLTVYAYAPTGMGGTLSAPNAFQLFVKTGSAWTWYETPWAAGQLGPSMENTWIPLSIDMSGVANADDVKELGVKFGASGSMAGTLSGTIYVDDMQAIPEPSSLILLGTGLAGLVGFAVRKKK